ncbi:MAG: TIGR03790 family protein [Calditrichaceae bacterium]
MRYKIMQFDTLGQVLTTTFRESLQDNPENVLVLYNINYLVDENKNNIWDGYEIASYYVEKRGIPGTNLVGIKAPVNSEISRAEYDSYYDETGKIVGIRQQVENILNTVYDDQGSSLRSKIKYIVLTRGIPHRIRAYETSDYYYADYSSVDAALSMVFNGNYSINGRIENPYFRQDPAFEGTSPFVPEFYTNTFGNRLSFLVSRLDGYSVSDVKTMIKKGIEADTESQYHSFVVDDAQKYYDRMDRAYLNLKNLGASVYPDPWADDPEPITSIADSVAGIVTHGVYAGLDPDYLLTQFNFKLGKGAIFSSYESYNGVSFSTNVKMGQGQVSDFIRSGGSGGVGNVYEPYSSGIADESVLFPAYFKGYTFAEAAYMSLPYLDWTSIVVGDPLMRIGPEISPLAVDEFRIVAFSPELNKSNQAVTTVAEIVFSDYIDANRLPAFILSTTSDTLRSYTDGNFLYLWTQNPLPPGTTVEYRGTGPVYSVAGDSILTTTMAKFTTNILSEQADSPVVYRSFPSGIDVHQNSDLRVFFSQSMAPETIYPLFGEPKVAQTHSWNDNRILTVTHESFLPATRYYFYIDEHAKSADLIQLAQKYNFTFETEYNFIAFDLDNDNYPEYAHNLNQTLLDGYEVYADSGGVETSLLDSSNINNDNQKEFFIKIRQNPYPSYFWDPGAIPYTGYIASCVPIDDDEDSTLEYAFDENGSGFYTKVYDLNDVNRVRDIKFVQFKSVPQNNAQNVSLTPSIELEFSYPVDFNSVENNIQISPEVVFQSIQNDLNGRKIIIHPADSLQTMTVYTITILDGLSSIKGEKLPHDYNISFTTVDETPVIAPEVISFYPGDSLRAIDNSPTVRFIFSSGMNTNTRFPVIADTSTGIFWNYLWANEFTLYLFPAEQLRDTTTYSFKISAELNGKNGLPVEGKTSFSFISGLKSADHQQPSVLQALPPTGKQISADSKIRLIFSEWLATAPETWLTTAVTNYEQDYQWSAYGQNMFTIEGYPVWKPQSALQLAIDGTEARDNNHNTMLQDYQFNYFVLDAIIARDIDNDGIEEFVVDQNNNLTDGLEFYQDPGGIITEAVFAGDIDGDKFFDFLIKDSTGTVLLSWFPVKSDSGIIGFTEQTSDSSYDISVDEDDLVEVTVYPVSKQVKPVIPKLRKYDPPNATDDVLPFTPLMLEFNTGMDAFSVAQAVQINPLLSGKWTRENNSSVFKFTSSAGWSPSIIYEINLTPDYLAANGQQGTESVTFSFRSSDVVVEPGEISWQFPEAGETVHSQSNYYFAFTSPADTTYLPSFAVIQNLKSLQATGHWLSDTLLEVVSPSDLKSGSLTLLSEGKIRFFAAPELDFNSVTPFQIQDTLEFKLKQVLFERGTSAPVNQSYPIIFNQPADEASSGNIGLYKVVQSDTQQVMTTLLTRRNFIQLNSDKLDYSSEYFLKLSADLAGISGKKLGMDTTFAFTTEKLFTLSTDQLKWNQVDKFFVVSWPIATSKADRFEIYLSETFAEKPDTLNFSNLYNRTVNPSWVFDLQSLDEKAYIFVRLLKNERSYWSKPAVLLNSQADNGGLVSFPNTETLNVSIMSPDPDYFSSLSVWDASVPGWRSSKFISQTGRWSTDFELAQGKGVMLKSARSGRAGYMQSLSDTLRIKENNYPDKRYRSVFNPIASASAGDLADLFGDAGRIVVWDNSGQGWNEAVYDTVTGSWINNYEIGHLEPFYVYTSQGFEIEVSGQTVITKKMDKKTGNILSKSSSENSFPSLTNLIRFEETVYRIEVYENEMPRSAVTGCGIDTAANVAFINRGNLDPSKSWKFIFFDLENNMISEYEIASSAQDDLIIPDKFAISAPYPNPFNGQISVPLQIPAPGDVKIKIYNILGQLVKSDNVKIQQPQIYIYKWNTGAGTPVASGVYLIRAGFNEQFDIKKVILIK